MFRLLSLLFLLPMFCEASSSANQTNTLSPIFPQSQLPFTVSIEEASFQLPNGLHSGASASHSDKWVFIAGRTNGLHGFNADNDNFPPSQQNTVVYVVDPKRKKVYSRSLSDSSSGLTLEQVEQLSVTSPQFFQTEKTLYISGGYGTTLASTFNTKPVLSALDLHGLIKWVKHGNSEHQLARHLRQTSHPLLQVTGGYMTAVNDDLDTLLIFGQNFEGYYTDTSNGEYTSQIRRFKIVDKDHELSIHPKSSEDPDPSYRRRDLNVFPVILNNDPSYVALSGVFTLDTGVWTVPVLINSHGKSSMADPLLPTTFKQAMNHYVCPTVGMYSKSKKNMYVLLLGGISYGYFQNGSFQEDAEIPFINQITTIKIDKHNQFSQYLMSEEYPEILSTGSNPGNRLLFGAGAYFIPSDELSSYDNGVVKFDKIKKSKVLGYVVGGIMSTLPNTSSKSDSTASPYIFKVTLHR